MYWVKFGVPSTNLQTKSKSITFSASTIEGTIMHRNKLDGMNKHPWKAEITEWGIPKWSRVRFPTGTLRFMNLSILAVREENNHYGK